MENKWEDISKDLTIENLEFKNKKLQSHLNKRVEENFRLFHKLNRAEIKSGDYQLFLYISIFVIIVMFISLIFSLV